VNLYGFFAVGFATSQSLLEDYREGRKEEAEEEEEDEAVHMVTRWRRSGPSREGGLKRVSHTTQEATFQPKSQKYVYLMNT
jgi:hypothetical protein